MQSKFLAIAFLLLGLSLHAQSATAIDRCHTAYRRCEFRLGYGKRLPIYKLRRGTRRPFSARIRSRKQGMRIGMTNSNGVAAEFITPSGAFKINRFGTPKFTPSIFKPMRLPKGRSTKRNKRGSAIGHERLVGIQFLQAKGKCVRVFFTSYQVLDHRGKVIEIVQNVPRSARKCVVFRTK